LPREIGNLRSLVILHIDDNQLISLPCEIGSLGNLRSLQIDNNPFISLPFEMERLFNNRVCFPLEYVQYILN
jgi:Leucine-rich repeat (LRR) protein